MRFLTNVEIPWKDPSQERSRERVAAILAAARQLIAESGLGGLKMGLLAERAGVPIGTIYQFFPDKDAVIGCIFAGQMEEAIAEVYRVCNPGHELERPAEATTEIVRTKYREWRDDPVMAEIWSIVQANRTLRLFAVEASRTTADIKVQALKPFLKPGVSEGRLWRVCFMISDLYDSAIRTALDFPEDEAAKLIDEYASLVSGHIASLLK